MAQMVKNLPAKRETRVWSLGWEDPLEKGMATHSSILAWRNPMDRGAWWVTVHGVPELDTTERLTHTMTDSDDWHLRSTRRNVRHCHHQQCSHIRSAKGSTTGVQLQLMWLPRKMLTTQTVNLIPVAKTGLAGELQRPRLPTGVSKMRQTKYTYPRAFYQKT